MTDTQVKRNTKYAFLAVVEVPNLGYCGGLLVLSAGGRPIEFHCTSPVKANRAQQILYGQTLKEFLICDQIGESLVSKVRGELGVVLVDTREFAALANRIESPVVFVNTEESEQFDSENVDVLEIAGQRLEVYGTLPGNIEGVLKLFLDTLPLTEPFERIYQAIQEAHSVAA